MRASARADTDYADSEREDSPSEESACSFLGNPSSPVADTDARAETGDELEWGYTDADVDTDADMPEKLSGSIRPLLQRRLSHPESEILMNAKAQWISSKTPVRTQLFKDIASRLRELPEVKSLNNKEWEDRQKIYKTWLYNQRRRGANHSRIKVGRSWTARTIVQEERKEEIRRVVEDEFHEKFGTDDGFRVYQKAVSRVLNRLPPEHRMQAEVSAANWNLDRGPPLHIKARNASHHAEDVFREFAQEMWRSCGMRMAFLVGWKNINEEIATICLNFNDKIRGREKFSGISKICKEWEEYIGTSFEPQGPPESDADSTDEVETASWPCAKSQKRPKDDPVKAAMREDGSIWIGDIRGLSRGGLQHIVRGFLTAHYRIASGHEKATAPFKRLPLIGNQMIDACYLPTGFEFPGDPSHMQKGNAIKFLEFIKDRQLSCPEDVFKFQKWLNDSGELEDPVDVALAKESSADGSGPGRRRARAKSPKEKGAKATQSRGANSVIHHTFREAVVDEVDNESGKLSRKDHVEGMVVSMQSPPIAGPSSVAAHGRWKSFTSYANIEPGNRRGESPGDTEALSDRASPGSMGRKDRVSDVLLEVLYAGVLPREHNPPAVHAAHQKPDKRSRTASTSVSHRPEKAKAVPIMVPLKAGFDDSEGNDTEEDIETHAATIVLEHACRSSKMKAAERAAPSGRRAQTPHPHVAAEDVSSHVSVMAVLDVNNATHPAKNSTEIHVAHLEKRKRKLHDASRSTLSEGTADGSSTAMHAENISGRNIQASPGNVDISAHVEKRRKSQTSSGPRPGLDVFENDAHHRRSGRTRKAPLPLDSDVPDPEKAICRKPKSTIGTSASRKNK